MCAITSRLSPITLRRLAAFRDNRRARVSLWLFAVLFLISLFAELIANYGVVALQRTGRVALPRIERRSPELSAVADAS